MSWGRWALYSCALGLMALGLIALHSVRPDALRQGAYGVLGVVLMIGLTFVHYVRLRKIALWLYVASVGALGLVMLPGIGQASRGAQRWLSLGPLGTFQPSEMAKLALILMLAVYLSPRVSALDEEEPRVSGKRFLGSMVLVGIPFVLTAIQPDLGSALVLGAIWFCMLFLAGASPLYLGGLIVSGLGVLPYVLHGYQRNRLLVFLDPSLDPRGLGYNLLQARTAIGSGGIYGEGLGSGGMSQHGFVPENSTDFIITVIGEELGLIGCLGLLALYAILLGLLARICRHATDRFGTLLVIGTTAMLSFQILVNLGMNLGMMPAVGIPLPFISYGGSSLLVSFAGLGIAASVARVARGREGTTPIPLDNSDWEWVTRSQLQD